MMGTTIQQKLQGTVYDLDLDEELAEDVENLKSMRDRRRSIDSRMDSFRTKDASESPKFTGTPIQKTPRQSYQPPEIRDTRPPVPILQEPVPSVEPIIPNHVPTSIHTIIPPIVMPGPVDMRTYNSSFEVNTDAFNSTLLGVFGSGISDPTLQDIDEEVEKDFQMALRASNTKAPVAQVECSEPILPVVPLTVEPVIEDAPVEVPQSKQSLIKLKIKGPHARPENYTSTVITTLPSSILDSSIPEFPNPYTPIRRMRKKELLRQYCTQENMDVAAVGSQPSEQAPNYSFIPPSGSGRSAGIPKAVDSMSSIPTKDDYKDYTTAEKKRKTAASRELRGLDHPYDSDKPERRRSICSNASTASGTNAGDGSKRKTRTKQTGLMTTPKLKIKLAGITSIVDPTTTDHSCGNARPPKKRALPTTSSSYEDYQRSCMNYRKDIISQYNSAKKEKQKDKTKVDKRKKKKEKKLEKKRKMEIVSNEISKIVIKISKPKLDGPLSDAAPPIAPANPSANNDNTPSSNDPLPSAPIRLKLSRNSNGGGYVMVSTTASNKVPTPERKDDTRMVTNCQVVLTGLPKTITNEVKLNKSDEQILFQSHQNSIERNHQQLHSEDGAAGNMTQAFQHAGNSHADLIKSKPAELSHSNSLTDPHGLNDSQTRDNNINACPQLQNAMVADDRKGSDDNSAIQKIDPILPLSKDCEVR